MTKKFKIGVLLSGSGTTLQYLIDGVKNGSLHFDIAMVISNTNKAFGLERAKNAEIPSMVISSNNKSVEEYSKDIYQIFKSKDVDLVVMAGFLKMYLPPEKDIPTINTHPSLLPAFGGKGMFGIHVHQAVADYGCKVSGVTIHFVTEEYDTGPVILQRVVEILPEDDAKAIQEKVTTVEKPFLGEVINLFVEDKVQLKDRKVFIS